MDFYIKIELKNKLEQCKRIIMMSQKKKKEIIKLNQERYQ